MIKNPAKNASACDSIASDERNRDARQSLFDLVSVFATVFF
jgi:hypothetical protein